MYNLKKEYGLCRTNPDIWNEILITKILIWIFLTSLY
jgi:hypothetical protein